MVPISASGQGGSASSKNDLSNYMDLTSKLSSSGYHAPVINLATGGSQLNPTMSANDGGNWITYVAIGVAVLALFFTFKKSKA